MASALDSLRLNRNSWDRTLTLKRQVSVQLCTVHHHQWVGVGVSDTLPGHKHTGAVVGSIPSDHCTATVNGIKQEEVEDGGAVM